ncbi:MAG TPA: helix-turn-helix domain-containing protein [Methanoregulaceae archaeon]|nr:helix-turn-helix domain-containing protein [Methanoregulaceae archaeon]HQJ87038.1 helix-turn-helix domain-containing protein [Methanoregulaceae archaeon]
MDNGPRILHPGDPETQTLARAIASPTAGEILKVLGEEPMTASALSTRLSIPMTTAAYHLEHLVDAGVIEVKETRWSRKGREQKVYRLVDRVVIVSPAREDLGTLLRKYAALGIALGATAVIAALWEANNAAPAIMKGGTEQADGMMPGAMTVPATGTESVVPFILLGGIVVLLALVVYDRYLALKARRE